MIGIGTIVNVLAIIIAGIIGLLFGQLMKQRYQETLNMACGICVLFLGIAGTMEHMLTINNGTIKSGQSMKIIICLALGAILGEMLNIEEKMENFGQWLKEKSGNSKDKQFVDGFVTTTLTVCIGAMAIVGALQDGIFHDPSILMTKAVLDFIIVLVMTCTLGKGCMFSAIPVGLFQGSITLLAVGIEPFMTEMALSHIGLIGSILIFCVGMNLIWGKKVRVANLLPALIFAIGLAFLPIG